MGLPSMKMSKNHVGNPLKGDLHDPSSEGAVRDWVSLQPDVDHANFTK